MLRERALGLDQFDGQIIRAWKARRQGCGEPWCWAVVGKGGSAGDGVSESVSVGAGVGVGKVMVSVLVLVLVSAWHRCW